MLSSVVLSSYNVFVSSCTLVAPSYNVFVSSRTFVAPFCNVLVSSCSIVLSSYKVLVSSRTVMHHLTTFLSSRCTILTTLLQRLCFVLHTCSIVFAHWQYRLVTSFYRLCSIVLPSQHPSLTGLGLTLLTS